MKLPLKLLYLGTWKPNDIEIMGVDSALVSVEVSTNTPLGALATDLRRALSRPVGRLEPLEAKGLVQEVLRSLTGDFPFQYLAPEEPPEDYAVRRHPTIDDMWLVIDPERDILGSWPTKELATEAAWEDAWAREDVEEGGMPARPRAYFALEWTKPLPEGYEVKRDFDGKWIYLGPLGELGVFDTDFGATLAAWRHYLSQEDSQPEFIAGDIEGPNDSGIYTAEIHHRREVDGRMKLWGARIEVHGHTMKEAQALRDRALRALGGEGSSDDA